MFGLHGVLLRCFVIRSEDELLRTLSEKSDYVRLWILLCSRSQILRCPQDDKLPKALFPW